MSQNNPSMKLCPDLGVFAGVQSRLAEVGSLLGQLGPDSVLKADLEDISQQLQALVKSVQWATPTERCPYCFGRGEGCRFCGGIGWVSLEKLALAPEELVQLANAAEGMNDNATT